MATGLIFSGQGSQKAAMGGPWRDTPGWSLVERIADASGHDIAQLLLDADDETLKRTDRAQISTFALEMVILEYCRARNEPAVACAGHSLGEYSALVGAGILDLDDAARLVAARGAAMLAAAEANPGTMIAAVGGEPGAVEAAIEPVAEAWVANINAPGQIVVAGTMDGIEAATAALKGIARALPLPVGGAFHSPLMAPAADELVAALDKTAFAPGDLSVVANVDARPHGGGDEWRDLLARQLTSPVQWSATVTTLAGDLHCDELVEIGPGKTLTGMVKRIAPDISCAACLPE
jgi:[acyl-carrier-protein] S-malonyltransferase